MADRLDLLALDLGASSGRAILGRFTGDRLELQELHRFENGPVWLPDGLHWDVLRIWSDVLQGIRLALRAEGVELAGVGLDTWGVDYGLLDASGALVSNPYHYRDGRTDGMFAEAFRRVTREEIFQQTGIQFIEFNTVFQLLSMVTAQSPALEIAETLLTMPDLLNYWLTGQKVCEFSIATTTQCYDPRKKDWAWPLLEALGIPTGIFPRIVPPGTVLGPIAPALAEELGAGRVPVIAPACHDTGSAVAAVPAEGDDFAYVSCGTWALLGTELAEPLINADSLAFGITNEGGVEGTIRFLKNITGLWLVQECRRQWQQEGDRLSWDELTQLAAEAEPLRSIIDPDHSDFVKPGDMPARIREYCRRTGQPAPESRGAVLRCALESQALKQRFVLENIERILGRRLEPIHMVGGGTQNRLLCQFTADAANRPVVTGPIEATAIGNLLTQATALGYIGSMADGRRIVRNSFEIVTLEPENPSPWDEGYARLLQVMAQAD